MKKKILILSLSLISILGIGQTIDQLGYYNKNGITGLSSKDNFMILSNGEIVDNSDPSAPTLISAFSCPDGHSVIVKGDYSYFGTGMSNNLFIADISNITFPIQESFIDFTIGNGVSGMDISENILFVSLGMNGIVCSIDITDNSNPIMLDTLYIAGGHCFDIKIQNDYLFAAHDGGLKIIDITNPSDLQLITSIGSFYSTIDINENQAYLGKYTGGVDVFDITDPTNPSPLFSILNSGGTALDLKYSENLLYLATNSVGLFIYKLESNAAEEMAYFQNVGNGQSFSVCLQDSLILLSGLVNGVAILQYDSTGTVGVRPLPSNEDIHLYPNPASSFVSIDNNGLPLNNIKIYDINGKLIKQIETNISNGKIDLSNLKNGEYILSFETNDKFIIKKVLKVD